jgi:biofilm PGA synthesis N-glycosyltransferase PgaC
LGFWVGIINIVLLSYTLILVSFYFYLVIVSVMETRVYVRKNMFTDYTSILASPIAPSVSIIATAYNEGSTIIDNIKSLTNIHYANY